MIFVSLPRERMVPEIMLPRSRTKPERRGTDGQSEDVGVGVVFDFSHRPLH
jgi:hypothetical protein